MEEINRILPEAETELDCSERIAGEEMRKELGLSAKDDALSLRGVLADASRPYDPAETKKAFSGC